MKLFATIATIIISGLIIGWACLGVILVVSCSKKTQPKTSAVKGMKLNLPPGDYLLIGNTVNGVPGDTINIRIVSADTVKVIVK